MKVIVYKDTIEFMQGRVKNRFFVCVPLLQLKYLFAGSFYEKSEYMGRMLRKMLLF